MYRKVHYVYTLLFLLAAGMIALPAGAMTNPSAGYCTGLGYQYTDVMGADGSMTGHCLLANNQNVDAWQFLQGNVSTDQSYCSKQGLQIRTVSDPAVCGLLGSTCAVCVKADGTTQEVTAMMGLDFREKICNDKICCDPATDKTCAIGAEPADWTLYVIIAIVILLILVGIAFLLIRKKGREPAPKNP